MMTPEQQAELRKLVLPLQWDALGKECIRAESLFGLYEVMWGLGVGGLVYLTHSGKMWTHSTVEAAQAAAQLDCADRILAALDQTALLGLLDTVRANQELMVREQEARRLLECALWVKGEGDADAARAWLGGAK
jgi:hypothetical protein